MLQDVPMEHSEDVLQYKIMRRSHHVVHSLSITDDMIMEFQFQRHIWRKLNLYNTQQLDTWPYLYCVVNIYCQGLSHKNNPNEGRNLFSEHGPTNTILREIKHFNSHKEWRKFHKNRIKRYCDHWFWSSHINSPYSYSTTDRGCILISRFDSYFIEL